MTEPPGKARHRAQRAVPKRIDLDGLTDAGRHHPVADLGIHPRELDSRLARAEEAVGRVLAYAVSRTLPVGRDDLFENGEEILYELHVAGCLLVLANSLEVPEGGVHRVVLGGFPGIREPVRQHPAIHEAGEGRKDASGDLVPARGQQEPGQRDHGVPSPVGEPRIARDDGLPAGIVHERPGYDELVGGQHQLLDPPRHRPRSRRRLPPGPEQITLVHLASVPRGLPV